MSRYGPRIAALARRAERDREAFDPAAVEDPEAAYLHEGAGQAIWLYIQARTGGRFVPFSDAEFSALEESLHTWLALYAACYGVDIEPDVSLRTAAEMLIETRNIEDTAQLLTDVPQRDDQ